MKKSRLALIVILAILFLDQISKFWVKTNMFLGQEFPVLGNWFIIHFTENEGMAFGLTFGGEYGKLLLSLFRIGAVIFIGYYLVRIIKDDAPTGLVVCFSLIFAGAIGNIIDSVFYGVLFSDSYHKVAEFLPEGGGYASLLYGKVVDMLYFPLWEGYLPDWLPFWGGDYFIFFQPVFNIADSSIFLGVVLIIIFQKHFFTEKIKEEEHKKGIIDPVSDAMNS